MRAQNTISNVLAAAGLEMANMLGDEGMIYARDMMGEMMVRHYPKTMDKQALVDNRFWHLYELGHVGNPRYRLFKMNRKDGIVWVTLRPAKMLIPLSRAQRTPGPTGRRVTKRYRFPARPWVYEYGKTMTIQRKPGTKFMWGFNTWPIPPQRGPVIVKPGLQYRFHLRESTRKYFRFDGTMHMNQAARKYAQVAKRSTIAAMRLAK